jgi:GMP synthase (glutamine-hydrolysing)
VKRVLVIQHEPFEGPGTLRDALSGCELRILRTYDAEPVPATLEEDGLVVLGGGMGVSDADRLPYLRDEMRLLAGTVGAGRPVLAVCLGSQLLAAALGGKVSKAPRKEIGWYTVDLLAGARDDLLFAAAPESFTAFHWHGDAFTLPAGAAPLASSALTPFQAFRAGPRAWGFQFHLETDRQTLDAMLSSGEAELIEAGVDPSAVRARASEELPRLQRLAREMVARWASFL